MEGLAQPGPPCASTQDREPAAARLATERCHNQLTLRIARPGPIHVARRIRPPTGVAGWKQYSPLPSGGEMTQAPASSVGTRVRLDPFVSSASRPAEPAGLDRRAAHGRPFLALVPALSERRRAENRQNLGLVDELRCECATPGCRETFPAAADRHRGDADRFIVAPAHLNGGTAVKVADRFFVISSPLRL